MREKLAGGECGEGDEMRIETDWLIPQQKVIKYLFPTKSYPHFLQALVGVCGSFHRFFISTLSESNFPCSKLQCCSLHKSNWIRRLWCSGVTYGEEKLETSRKFWNKIMLLLLQSLLSRSLKFQFARACMSGVIDIWSRHNAIWAHFSRLFLFGPQLQLRHWCNVKNLSESIKYKL